VPMKTGKAVMLAWVRDWERWMHGFIAHPRHSLDPRSCCQTAGLLRQENASGCPGIHPISVLEATSIFLESKISCIFASDVANDSCGCPETRIVNVTHAVVYLLVAVLSLAWARALEFRTRHERIAFSPIRDATHPHTSQWSSSSHCLG
jgi:hypothetical protein